MTYAGGCGGLAGNCSHCDAAGHKEHLKYFKHLFPNDVVPEHVTKCICGMTIKENCFIQCKDGLVIIGNECINRFIDKNEKGRKTCARCGDNHRNHKDNFCNSCRKEIKECEKKRKKTEAFMRNYKPQCIECSKIMQNALYEKCWDCYMKETSKLGPEWFCDCGKKKGKISYSTCWNCHNNHKKNDICSTCYDHPSGMYACEGIYIPCVDCGGGHGGEY